MMKTEDTVPSQEPDYEGLSLNTKQVVMDDYQKRRRRRYTDKLLHERRKMVVNKPYWLITLHTAETTVKHSIQ